MIEAYPLQWPIGRSRTTRKKYGQFKVDPAKIKRDLLKELHMMGVTSYVINSNSRLKADGMPYANQYIEDTGVVLYFTRKGKDIAIACDKYYQVNDNLRAIGLSLGAIRGMERWGTEEMVDRAFTGFAALPESTIVTPPPDRQKRDWWVVLGCNQHDDVPTVKQAYRRAQSYSTPRRWWHLKRFSRSTSCLRGVEETMSEFGTYLVEFNDGSKVIFGNNYKPWWQHATEYVYRFMGDRKGIANRGWRYEYVEDVVVSVSHSDTPFYDDGGLKWCSIGEYQDVINDVSRNSENSGVKRVKAENIVFVVSPSLKATLTKKLKRF